MDCDFCGLMLLCVFCVDCLCVFCLCVMLCLMFVCVLEMVLCCGMFCVVWLKGLCESEVDGLR